MKKLKALLISLLALSVMGGMAACGQTPDNGSTPDTSISDTTDSSTGDSTDDSTGDSTGDETPTPDPAAGAILQAAYTLESGATMDGTHTLTGVVTNVKSTGEGEACLTFVVDGYEQYPMYCFWLKGEAAGTLAVGDTITVTGTIKNYNGTVEYDHPNLVDFVKAEISDDDYVEMNILAAREAKEGALVKTSGIVAQITYAEGMKPNGFFLVDDTASIYVFSSAVAPQVSVGNTVTILSEKTWWILDKEQSNAATYNYKGCNQLSEVKLLSNDKGSTEFNTEWMEEKTVKEIMDTPVSTDITTTIFKTTALVKKVPGNNFVNYYINDLDETTGSYSYSQASGADFAWLDEFDGKICTVYLTAINAKSTASGCNWRFVPIKVVDENYQFNTANAGQFVVEYYGVDQFEAIYNADPALELTTSVSSELLGFENATLSYASDNENVITFAEEEGKTVMHCVGHGTATITITGEYNDIAFEKTVTITFMPADAYNTITVAQAIEAAIDSTVTVRGIVGPSVVNKQGFYFFGEDGSVITVLLKNASDFASFKIGNDIILTGMRERYVEDDAATYAGQTCIVDAEILANLQGNHEYSTEKFVTDKTVEDFRNLDGTVDYSTTVFVLNVIVVVESTNYYTKMSLKSPTSDTTITAYCQSANQYAWLQEYAGQEITIEIAACNWNNKKFWAGCVLAVRLADGTKVLNTLNFN